MHEKELTMNFSYTTTRRKNHRENSSVRGRKRHIYLFLSITSGFLPSLSSRKKKEGEGFFCEREEEEVIFKEEERREGGRKRAQQGSVGSTRRRDDDDDENDDDDDDDENDEKKRLSLEEDLLLSGENGVFHCPITQEIFEHPVTLRCGHTFSKTSLMRWMAKNPCCPTCRKSQLYSTLTRRCG